MKKLLILLTLVFNVSAMTFDYSDNYCQIKGDEGYRANVQFSGSYAQLNDNEGTRMNIQYSGDQVRVETHTWGPDYFDDCY